MLVAFIATCVILCNCSLSPTCPCYYHKYRSTQTVVVAAQQTPRVVTATIYTTTTTKTKNYQPPSLFDTAPSPTATTINY